MEMEEIMNEALKTGGIEEPDEKFEEFLAAEVAKLSENRRKIVARLARGSYYGEDILRKIFSEDAKAPAPLDSAIELPTRMGAPRYEIADIEAAEDIVDAHEDAA
jgi:hypothetical protein